MDFDPPLVKARLLRRYKRFLADVEFADGQTATAHVANPGAMTGLAEPGQSVWLAPNTNPKAKLDWRWTLTDAEGTLVVVNTGYANTLVREALSARTLPSLGEFDHFRAEVPYGTSSRIDFLLERGDHQTFVEVKSVTLRRGDAACFPDAVTARGKKHLEELMGVCALGHRAVMFYVVMRGDCTVCALAEDIDPAYAETAHAAATAGVEFMALEADITSQCARLGEPIPFRDAQLR